VEHEPRARSAISLLLAGTAPPLVVYVSDESADIQRGCPLDAAIAECGSDIAVRCTAHRPPRVGVPPATSRS
jgi:hypothetical protein